MTTELHPALLTLEEFERLPADCGFVLFDEPPKVRAPDAAFDIRLIPADGEIDGADVLPGFRRRVSDLLGD